MARTKSESTTAILKEIYPKVMAAVKNNKTAYARNIGTFINARHEALYDNGPYTRIYWTAEDTNKFYSILKLKPLDIQNSIAKTYYSKITQFNPRCAKDPFTVAQLCCIRYFVQNNMKKEIELACTYLAFSGSFYPSIHYGSFPDAQPQDYRHIMEYVINNELTQKYDLKREGTLIGAVRSITNTWVETYKKQGLFSSFSDEDCVYLLQQFHDRVKSMIINIAKLYYEVYNDKDKYLSFASDNYSEEEFRLADNDSLKAERYTMAAMNYITTRGVNYKICQMSADSNVRTDEVKSIIETIQMDKKNIPLIKEFIHLSIVEFMVNSETKDIHSPEYLSCTIVAKPNTKNPNVLRMKEIITHLLDENSQRYRRRKNVLATQNSYIRSVSSYYALIVNQANK